MSGKDGNQTGYAKDSHGKTHAARVRRQQTAVTVIPRPGNVIQTKNSSVQSFIH